MPNIAPSAGSLSNASSRSSSPEPGESESGASSGPDADTRPRTAAGTPPPLPERPEFLKRMQSSSGASARPPLRLLTQRIAETNVNMMAATLKTLQSAIDLARHAGGPTQHLVESLQVAEGRHERAVTLLDSITAEETERLHPVDVSSVSDEQARRAVDARLEAFAAQAGAQDPVERSRHAGRDLSLPPGNRAAVRQSAPASHQPAVRGPARPLHIQDVVLHYIEQDNVPLAAKGTDEVLDYVFDLGERLGLDENVMLTLRHALFPWNPAAQRKDAHADLERRLDEAIARKIDSRHHATVRGAIVRHMNEIFNTARTQVALTAPRMAPSRKPRL